MRCGGARGGRGSGGGAGERGEVVVGRSGRRGVARESRYNDRGKGETGGAKSKK